MNEVNFNRMFGQQGWICPKCGRVYSPFTQMCLYCGNNNSENTFTSANTPTKTFDEILESNRGMCWNGLRRKGTNMERCRIIRGEGCNGCIPIIIYWVQVRKDKRISYEWVNVKGFDTYKRAKELLNVLKGGIDYEQI